MPAAIVEKYYYVIKVICDNGKVTYYKIGEANNKKRPEALIEKYNKLRANNAVLLAFEVLPYFKDKRLNDKLIHRRIDAAVLKHADPIYVEHYLEEKDGKEEFFEAVDPTLDVVSYVAKVIASISAQDYTVNVAYNVQLEYAADKYHLVGSAIINKIFEKFPMAYRVIYKEFNNAILLIGQFDFDFIASIAVINKVYVWHDAAEQKHIYSFDLINKNIIYINNMEELINLDMNFDLIISNPPYGKIGANITKNIIDNVGFEQYINLLPANDYKRNTEKNLYQYAYDMEAVNSGFDDAAVTTHLCEIKTKAKKQTIDEFERSNYIDRQLDKYFEELAKRPCVFEDIYLPKQEVVRALGNATTVIFTKRDCANSHAPYTKNCNTYKWNVERSIDADYLIANTAADFNNSVSIELLDLGSAVAKDNFVKLYYSSTGFRFMSKLFTAVNVDSRYALNKIFAKVDWTRSWTVEEILADYGYTEDEIKEVMDDLKNFKGMED